MLAFVLRSALIALIGPTVTWCLLPPLLLVRRRGSPYVGFQTRPPDQPVRCWLTEASLWFACDLSASAAPARYVHMHVSLVEATLTAAVTCYDEWWHAALCGHMPQ